MMLRREVLASIAAFAAATPTLGWADEPGLQVGAPARFDPRTLIERAREMAAEGYVTRPKIPKSWRDLSYDQYRKIWFDARNALWEGTDAPQRVDVFPPGLYFPQAVAMFEVEDGISRPLLFDMDVFDKTDKFPDVELDGTLGYSGLRLRAELHKPDIFEEYAVFQGASYFRGLGAGESYGLSARGLAINTGDPEGEEFPDFIGLWLERPAHGEATIVMHALLDSPSVTGAYTFHITPGEVLRMNVAAHLFARTELKHIGIAPLTSMFLFDDTDRQRFDDFRPAVHDSDGLLIHNGGGESIWRPLANPTTLQISSFVDTNPKGFGLMQRKRNLEDFNDLEAHYHNRPSLWVTPGEGWGKGSVSLVEIPADLEIYDNIVAYWRPADVIPAGAEHQMSYQLDWGANTVPMSDNEPMRVLNTAAGARPEGGRVFAIDFGPGPDLPDDLDSITKVVTSSAGSVTEGILQRNPATGGVRLAFTFMPEDAKLAEFRVQLLLGDTALSELWLYRWTTT